MLIPITRNAYRAVLENSPVKIRQNAVVVQMVRSATMIPHAKCASLPSTLHLITQYVLSVHQVRNTVATGAGHVIMANTLQMVKRAKIVQELILMSTKGPRVCHAVQVKSQITIKQTVSVVKLATSQLQQHRA